MKKKRVSKTVSLKLRRQTLLGHVPGGGGLNVQIGTNVGGNAQVSAGAAGCGNQSENCYNNNTNVR